MKQKDLGIVLRKISYSETSLIVSLFCRNNGLKSFLFQGGKKKKGNLLHPLAVVELEFYTRTESEMGKISQIDSVFLAQNSVEHPVKSSLLFFFAEILQQVIHQDEQNEALFNFLEEELQYFDTQAMSPNYAIWWLVELSKWLGIMPSSTSKNAKYFDAMNGEILDTPESVNNITDSGAHIFLIAKILSNSKETTMRIKSTLLERKQAMNTMLTYFKTHLERFTFPKSLEVINEIWE